MGIVGRTLGGGPVEKWGKSFGVLVDGTPEAL